MVKYCTQCGKKLKKNAEGVYFCPNYKKHDKTVKVMTDSDEKHLFNQSCHQNIKKAYDLKQNSLCFIVIASILLIVGAIFLLLSFKYNIIKERVFTPGALEFVVSILCLAGGLFCMIFGIIRLIIAFLKKDYFTHLLKK